MRPERRQRQKEPDAMGPAFATPTGSDALWVLAAECIRTPRGWFAHAEPGTAYWLATVLLRDYEAAERAVHDTTLRAFGEFRRLGGRVTSFRTWFLGQVFRQCRRARLWRRLSARCTIEAMTGSTRAQTGIVSARPGPHRGFDRLVLQFSSGAPQYSAQPQGDAIFLPSGGGSVALRGRPDCWSPSRVPAAPGPAAARPTTRPACLPSARPSS